MKPIKFDLPLNGIRIATLEQLEENLTPEILEPFRSGKLAKWLRVRNLTEQAETVETLLAADVDDEVQLFKSLCEVFVSEVDENDAREAIEEYNALITSKIALAEEMDEGEQIELLDCNEEKQPDNFSTNVIAKNINEAQQLKLLEEGDENQRAELASYPDLSEKLQNRLLEDKEESVLVALASNPTLIEEVQIKLACTNIFAVREALAANPGLVEKQQFYLATTPECGEYQVRPELKCRLASNVSLAVDVQFLLAGDKDQHVYSDSVIREALAKNPSITFSVQFMLAGDSCMKVLAALASNPSLSDDVQAKLISIYPGLCKFDVFAALASNHSLSENVQAKLISIKTLDWNSECRCRLASNPSLVVSVQSHLASDKDSSVRIALAENLFIDRVCQIQLMGDKDVKVRIALAKNVSLSDELMAKLAVNDIVEVKESLVRNPSLTEYSQTLLIADNSGNVREIMASNLALNIAQQAELVNIGNVDVRLALLDNPSLDQSLKTRVLASFDNFDLGSMERNLMNAANAVDVFQAEYAEVSRKLDNPITTVFSAFRDFTSGGLAFTEVDEIRGQLRGISNRKEKAKSEMDVLKRKVCKLKEILSL